VHPHLDNLAHDSAQNSGTDHSADAEPLQLLPYRCTRCCTTTTWKMTMPCSGVCRACLLAGPSALEAVFAEQRQPASP
jgi:late competence protein required for DNA uptake (superfamily II DNA/RNA helicase)